MTWRAALPDELQRLWPAARSSHVADSLAELKDFHAAGPWRVRLSSSGDAMVLDRWRAHLDAVAIRALWVVESRVPYLVADAKAVGRAQGFSSLLSPLLMRSLHGPYVHEGFNELEPIVALQGIPKRVELSSSGSCGVDVRTASRADAEPIAAIDALSFDDFWRYGAAEIETILASERVTVAKAADGEMLGYASANIRVGTCTLGRLAVAPQGRRQGVGRALVSDVARWAAESGVPVLSLCTQESNAASRALYSRCGLVEVDERYGILSVEL